MVILGHQFEKYGLSHPLQVVQTFHMPLFFMFAGYFIGFHKDIGVFIKDKARRLLIPYLLCCIFITAYKGLIELIKTYSIDCGIHELLKWAWISVYASGSGHGSMIANVGTRAEIGMLWFLIALFWSIIFIRFIGQSRFAWFIVITISAVAILSTKIVWLPFSIQNGLGASFWVYLGCFVRQKELLKKITELKRIIPLVIVVWLISAVFGYTRLYACEYRLWLFDVLGDVCGCILVYKVSNYIAGKVGVIKKFLAYAGTNSLSILCVHFIENNTISAHKIVEILIPSAYPLIKAFLCWGLIIVTVIIAVKMLNKIKIIKIALGIN